MFSCLIFDYIEWWCCDVLCYGVFYTVMCYLLMFGCFGYCVELYCGSLCHRLFWFDVMCCIML